MLWFLNDFEIFRGNYGRLVDSVFDEEPKKIEHDVLMLWGDKDRALTPKTPEIESTFISGKVEIIRFPNGGHNLHMQERESVSKEMKKFLKIDWWLINIADTTTLKISRIYSAGNTIYGFNFTICSLLNKFSLKNSVHLFHS